MAGSVELQLGNGNLGGIPAPEDGISALVVSGVASGDIKLNVPLGPFYSLSGAEQFGFTQQYDETNEVIAHQHIKEFYDEADGIELWVMVLSPAVLMADYFDQGHIEGLISNSRVNGRIRLIGITRSPESTYNPDMTNGIDGDVDLAIQKSKTILEEAFTKYRPCTAIIEGRAYEGDVGSVLNYHDPNVGQYNRTHIWIGQDLDYGNNSPVPNADQYANVGFILGWVANSQVQRNAGRVKRGSTQVTNAGFSSNDPFEDVSEQDLNALDAKGYMFFWKHFGKAGYYVNDSYACVPLTDDYARMERGRTIDKCARIAYLTYLEEVNDDFEVDEDGKMDTGYIKNLQQRVEQDIALQMIDSPDTKEISSVRCLIDPDQNVLSTNTIKIELAIIPKGLANKIIVKLGFDNPQLDS